MLSPTSSETTELTEGIKEEEKKEEEKKEEEKKEEGIKEEEMKNDGNKKPKVMPEDNTRLTRKRKRLGSEKSQESKCGKTEE